MSHPQHQLKIVAGAGNYQDVIDLFKELATQAADVRQDMGPEDSIALRKAIALYLEDIAAAIGRLRNNFNNPSIKDAGE